MSNQSVATKTLVLPTQNTLQVLESNDPEKVLEFAHKAAKALMTVVNAKPKQTIINGERFLSFEDWLTVAGIYGTTVGVEFTKPIMKNDAIFGYEAKAVAYKNGVIISSAEASCFREESNWRNKPEFQLKSMAQTRACAKCLRNVFAWVVVLGGFKPTPSEEMVEETFPNGLVEDNQLPIAESRKWENSKVTARQSTLLRNLIIERVADDEERQHRLDEITDLTKEDASVLISQLLSYNF